MEVNIQIPWENIHFHESKFNFRENVVTSMEEINVTSIYFLEVERGSEEAREASTNSPPAPTW